MLIKKIDPAPALVLKFYSHAIILSRRDQNDILTEYPVDPSDVAAALAAKIEFKTGFISPDTIYIGEIGNVKLRVEYRKPQKTGIWLDGVENPIIVPMPGLLLFRRQRQNASLSYKLFAVKKRPVDLDAKLFRVPLPNINRGVCWGTVQRPNKDQLEENTMKADWDAILGTRFNTHDVAKKSKSHPKDIRQKYEDMLRRGTRTYPTRDLEPEKLTIQTVIEGMSNDYV